MNSRPLDIAAVLGALADYPDPETGRDIVGNKQVQNVRVEGSRVQLTLALTTHSSPVAAYTRHDVAERLKAKLPQCTEVEVVGAIFDRPPMPLGPIQLTAKSVIAVGSGKGGVGKSTIAASLAIGLQRAGCRTGLMDADVYGPSIPHLLGLSGRVEQVEGKIQPIYKGNMPVMSMGFLVPAGEAVVWRGPMLHGAITQFLRDTAWGDLDYLIIDMPPGTGDIALTLSQALPLSGAVVVCTPQEVALLDAVKAISMFRKVNINVLGMVENMSGFICPDCGKRYDIFGSGGARRRAEELNVPFLGEVPINIGIRTHGDSGQTVDNFSDPIVAPYLERLVFQLARNLSGAAAVSPVLPTLPVLG